MRTLRMRQHDALLPDKLAPRETPPLYATPEELARLGFALTPEEEQGLTVRQERGHERGVRTAQAWAAADARSGALERRVAELERSMELLNQRVLGLVGRTPCGS